MNARNARSSIGTPRMGRNCFGSPGPARTPAPAATTTTPTSGCEAAGELTDSLQPDDLEVAGRATGPSRQEHAAEALPRRFGQATLDAGHRTDLAPEPDLAEEQCVRRDGAIMDGGDEGGKDGKVGGWLHQPHATGHIHKYVETAEREPAAPLEHREQQGEAAMIETGRHALRRAESRLRGERLDFDEHRSRAFHQRRHRGP